ALGLARLLFAFPRTGCPPVDRAGLAFVIYPGCRELGCDGDFGDGNLEPGNPAECSGFTAFLAGRQRELVGRPLLLAPSLTRGGGADLDRCRWAEGNSGLAAGRARDAVRGADVRNFSRR